MLRCGGLPSQWWAEDPVDIATIWDEVEVQDKAMQQQIDRAKRSRR